MASAIVNRAFGIVAILIGGWIAWALIAEWRGHGNGAGPVTLEQFGASDYSVDVTNSLVDAAIAVSRGNGTSIQLGPHAYIIGTSGDVDLSQLPNVSIVGNPAATGVVPENATAPYTLALDPAHTIRLGDHSSLSGLRIVRRGITTPTSLRQALTEVHRFAGVAVTASGVGDVTLRDVSILGFAQGFYATTTAADGQQLQRVFLDHVSFDDTAGIWIDNCFDACMIDHMEGWPLVIAASGTVGFQQSPIAGFSSSGGVIEVTLDSTPATPLVTGDSIVIGHADQVSRFSASISGNDMTVTAVESGQIVPRELVNGVGETPLIRVISQTSGAQGGAGHYVVSPAQLIAPRAMAGLYPLPATNGRWTITVVDPTHFTLNGSRYTAYTGAPTNGSTLNSGQAFAYLGASTRTGAAYRFTNQATPYNKTAANVGGEHACDLYEYGYDIAFEIGAGHGPVSVCNLWSDGDQQAGSSADSVPIGINDLGLGGAFNGGSICCKARGVVVNTPDTRDVLNVNLAISAQGAGPTADLAGAALDVISGSAQMTGSLIGGNLNNGSAIIHVGDGAGTVSLSNEKIVAYTIRGATAFDTPGDCPKFSIDGVVSCRWTPALTAASPGRPIYGRAPTGFYTITGGTDIKAFFDIQDASLEGAAGAVGIAGLPLAAGDDAATCAFSQTGGIRDDPGYTMTAGQVLPGQNGISLSELAANGAPPVALKASNLGAHITLRGVCAYQM